mgnify:FL=1
MIKKECEEKAEECRLETLYNSALKIQTVQNEDNQLRAAKQFDELGTYKDSAERVQQCRDKAEEIRKEEERIKAEREKAEKERKAKAKKKKIVISVTSAVVISVTVVLFCAYLIIQSTYHPIGSTIKLGKYEQDNNTSNGTENIEWIVLAKDIDKMLVISDKAIDCKPYHSSYGNTTWEECSLRRWLNDTFVNEAFTPEEQEKILTTNIIADANPDYDTDARNDTEDKVFLLSIEEANRYFNSDSERRCVPTEYAKANGAFTFEKDDTSNCFWWLRSQGGYSNKSASVVNSNGTVGKYGNAVDYNGDCVRPAMWISLT